MGKNNRVLCYDDIIVIGDELRLEGVTLEIRKVKRKDLKQIQEIYNHAIVNLTSTFDEEPRSFKAYESWFELHQNPNYPLLVAVENTSVKGWASISPLHPRTAARFTGETSVYIKNDSYHKGIGSQLLKALLNSAIDLGFHSLVALVVGNNQPSVRLHEKFGYRLAGKCEEVAFKFDTWLDLLIMQKKLY